MRIRRFSRPLRTCSMNDRRSPHASRMRVQSSAEPPYASPQAAGSGSSPSGISFARTDALSLFHSTW